MTPGEEAIRREMERNCARWLQDMGIEPTSVMEGRVAANDTTLCRCGCEKILPPYIVRSGRRYLYGHSPVGQILARLRTENA